MLRFQVSEAGQGTLPAIDIADDPVVIGSGAGARLRLPVAAARESHVRVSGGKWVALGDVIVDGTLHKAGGGGDLGAATVLFELGTYRVRVSPAPADAAPSTPQRTESIARELVRAMLGAGASPAFEIERGPSAGSTRELPPPEATMIIGRGDEADWIILDEDLSRAHAEVRRGWDGVSIRDRGSKNGTLVDGVRATGDGAPLHDGAVVTMGKVRLRFRDPAERHLRGDATPQPPLAELTPARPPPQLPPPPREPTPALRERSKAGPVTVAPAVARPSVIPFAIATTIAVLAMAALAYVLAV